jgi:translation initiation factor 5A
MSDSEDHQFESKADAGASKTYPQQAGTVRKGGYLVIKNRPCKVYIYPRLQPCASSTLSMILL